MDLGLQRAGFECVLALDSDGICAETHRRNFPKALFLNKRIGELTQQELQIAVGNIGSIDLLAGGPPCPPFSKSRFYRTEKPRALADPHALETISGFLNCLEWLRPSSFILENVKGLTYKIHREALDTILNRARELGYITSYSVLNAADFGVPQIRERCFVVGSRYKSITFPSPTHRKAADNTTPLWRTAGDALFDLDTVELSSDVGHFAGGRHHDLLKDIPPGDNYLFYTAKRGHINPQFKWRSRYWSFLLKLSRDLPSRTIQARRSNNMGPFHWRNRILRMNEIKRLQTFPDDFLLSGNIDQQWRQIGNAVPPMLAEAVGKAVLNSIQDTEWSE